MAKSAESTSQRRLTRLAPAGAMTFARAADILRAGGLVAFPTETVYGLGTDACQAGAVADLYAAKGRPAFNPLIVHVGDLAAAERIGRFGPQARALAERFWPGPLTLVVPAHPDSPVARLATAGLDTVALRVPAHPVAQAIIAAFGGPIVAPSANRSGHVSPTEARHVMADLDGRIDLVVDGGACPVGIESTIVGCVDAPVLLRPGAITRREIERVLGTPPDARRPHDAAEQPRAPGMLAQHYAPRAKVRLAAREVEKDEALLAFGGRPAPGASRARQVLNLSPSGDLREAATHLFDYLRALDRPDIAAIAVMPIPDEGLGEAINDRLRRAAAPASAPAGEDVS